jgi:hypothetical protein
MTIKDIESLLNVEDENPMDCLVGILAILRSAMQGETATDEGVTASVRAWKNEHGEVTSEAIRDWVASLPESLTTYEFPEEFVMSAIKPDDPFPIPSMDDDSLELLMHTVDAEMNRRVHLIDDNESYAVIKDMDDEQLEDLDAMISDEIYRRHKDAENEAIDKAERDANANEEASEEDYNPRLHLQHRAVHLVRMIQLNAPDIMIDRAFLAVKSKIEELGIGGKWKD